MQRQHPGTVELLVPATAAMLARRPTSQDMGKLYLQFHALMKHLPIKSCVNVLEQELLPKCIVVVVKLFVRTLLVMCGLVLCLFRAVFTHKGCCFIEGYLIFLMIIIIL